MFYLKTVPKHRISISFAIFSVWNTVKMFIHPTGYKIEWRSSITTYYNIVTDDFVCVFHIKFSTIMYRDM